MPQTIAIVPDAETAAPEALDASDLAFHAHVLAQTKTLAALEEQIRELQERAVAINGARAFWIDYLGQKYGLVKGDQVTADGAILRKPVMNGTA